MDRQNEDPAGMNRGAENDNHSTTNRKTHSKANGGAQDQYPGAPEKEPFEPLTFIDVSRWDELEPPAPEYVVPGRIPAKQVTLFTGEGGTGKSLLAQQLCTAATLINREWFGVVPWYGSTIYLDAEETQGNYALAGREGLDSLRRTVG
jgi:RecA-family ATPase